VDTALLPIDLLLRHFLQHLAAAHQRLQLADCGSGRRPGQGLLRLADVGKERRSGLVRLGARESALGVGRDARRVDQADPVAGLIEDQGHGRSVRTRSFQTGMDLLCPLLAHPGGERREPTDLHGEGASGELSWEE
jgi:hypothetical protein